MRARAEQIGGRVEIASDAGGTRVRLWLSPG
jgi:signal transduction histidine kinase